VFFILSKILDLAFSPLTWVLALLGLATLRRRTAPKRRRRLAVLAAATLYVFALDPVQNRLTRALELPADTTARPDVVYDAVILLGGLIDSRASAASHTSAYNDASERLLVTYEWLRLERAKFVIVSSGDGDGSGVREADLLGRQLQRWGIAPERILLENESRNTRENALLSKAIIDARGFRTLLLVTSAFHMRRARGCFQAVGLEVDTLSADFRSYDPATTSLSLLPRSNHLAASTGALREFSGRWVYGLRGFTSDRVRR
jgi:uncharacterized SAM-binding protein YcdF (DUF218 family)